MALSLREKDEEIARLRGELALTRKDTRKDTGGSGEVSTANGSAANEGSGDGTSGTTVDKESELLYV